ncbi:MAG: hypothetical protein R6V01_11540 [Thermoplasmatota archaeon]
MTGTRIDPKPVFIVLFVIVFFLSVIITSIISNIENDGEDLGPYTKEIELEYDNELELSMIQKAENLTPPDGSAWYDTFDNIKLADCVCRESIDYYSELIDDIEEDPDLVGITIKEAEMTYTARVVGFLNNGSYNTTDDRLYRVELNLSFHEYMGPLAAMWYDHYRTVVMTEDLEVLDVQGDDEKSSVIVS